MTRMYFGRGKDERIKAKFYERLKGSKPLKQFQRNRALRFFQFGQLKPRFQLGPSEKIEILNYAIQESGPRGPTSQKLKGKRYCSDKTLANCQYSGFFLWQNVAGP